MNKKHLTYIVKQLYIVIQRDDIMSKIDPRHWDEDKEQRKRDKKQKKKKQLRENKKKKRKENKK